MGQEKQPLSSPELRELRADGVGIPCVCILAVVANIQVS
jgi:hypothetical protein